MGCNREDVDATSSNYRLNLGMASIASIPVSADTITISYNFAGATTAPPAITGITLTVDGLAAGSVTQWNTAVNTPWNPVTFHTHNVVDVTNDWTMEASK